MREPCEAPLRTEFSSRLASRVSLAPEEIEQIRDTASNTEQHGLSGKERDLTLYRLDEQKQ